MRRLPLPCIIWLCLGLAACAAPAAAPPTSVPVTLLPACAGALPVASETAMNYLALGDSYTIGESVPASERWPVQLADLLRGEGIDLGQPTLIARTGWTTAELADAIDEARPAGPYELVSLLIGVNNQYRGRSVEEYRKQFVFLLNRAIVLADGRPARVLVLSIPDWGVTPYAQGRDRAAIGAQIDQFNAVNAEEAARAGALYVDVAPTSRLAADDPRLIAGDGLHPSGAMYAAWAALALPVVCQALAQPRLQP